MAGDRVAVIGVGQTVHRTARKDVSMAGLVREVAQEAVDDAGAPLSEIDAVALGAPVIISSYRNVEGLNEAQSMSEDVLIQGPCPPNGEGRKGKPMIRVHT